jgi:DNA-binding SARP family transcriptional activator
VTGAAVPIIVNEPVRFALLGHVRARRGQSELDLGPPQQRAMLALLLLHRGGVVSLDELRDQMWGSSPPRTASAAIHTYASRLRRTLAGVDQRQDDHSEILSSGGGYRLPITPETLDLVAFEYRVSEARAARARGDLPRTSASLHGALALWQGRALVGVHGDFVEHERNRLEELRVITLEERIVVDLELGRHHDVLAELTGLVSTYPLRERLRELLMLSLYRAGRQADALHVYQQTRTLLNGELGIDPGPGLRSLQQKILRSDPELSVPGSGLVVAAGTDGLALGTPAQLPAGLPDFTGREAELAHLLAVLRRTNKPNIAGLSGLGGVGKTALAVHAAHHLRGDFPDGQVFVDLGAGDERPVHPFEVLGRFLSAVGVPATQLPETLVERSGLWRSLLHQRRMLIVLDNASSSEQVRPLLAASSGSAALVTTPYRLCELTEVDWQVLGGMTAADAIGLFTSIVGPERERDEPAPCARLLASCAYLPLAIRVAGARVRKKPFWQVGQIEQQLYGNLVEVQIDAHGDQRLLYGPVRRAQRRLDDETVTAFRLASLPEVSTLSPGSAAALLNTTRERAMAILDALIDVYLLEPLHDGHYGFLNPVKVIARRDARVSDSQAMRQAALERLWLFYRRSEQNAQYAIKGRPPVRMGGTQQPSEAITFTMRESAQRWLTDTQADRAGLFHQLHRTSSAATVRQAHADHRIGTDCDRSPH